MIVRLRDAVLRNFLGLALILGGSIVVAAAILEVLVRWLVEVVLRELIAIFRGFFGS